ncbi:Cytochrome b561 [hydrothermal vent metagenome]|uniref:Cytochrome b561 n=1 Tax=hydrothermal vent metagenome TaxID=652676 RepID=A0A3B0SCR9_9ZZZZ
MALGNSPVSYGSVAKWFHWLMVLLILVMIPVGIITSNMAETLRDPSNVPDQASVALTVTLFSVHKTLGVSLFFLALARIIWAMTQPKPGLLNGNERAEAWLAETVHWMLYGALVLVPLSGWIYHAATTGFAPIWWPFGQGLPFVPKSHAVADVAYALHYILQWILIAAIALHVAGALKHHVIDHDATLRRMLPGHCAALPTSAQPGHARPAITAVAFLMGLVGGVFLLGWSPRLQNDAPTASTEALAQVESDWQVQNGALWITIKQLGSDITGQFDDWTADISYDEKPDSEGKYGSVSITVNLVSLNLGSVTSQVMGAGYFDVKTYPVAVYDADIIALGGGQIAHGSLTIRDQSVPLDIPFELQITGGEAIARGQATVDRRDFGMGLGVAASSLGFEVTIGFELMAKRAQ